jgi:uncharacterized protein (TIGR02145 family)
LLLSCSNNQKFKTVTIGDQVWMAENLNVDKFRNGDPIPHAQTAEEWQQAGENGQPAWCYYDNDPANGKIYGKLYNWYAVSDWRGLAPEGWRIPSDEDWEKLIKLLGGEEAAGGKLKATDTTYWQSPNTGANNETGFSALPSGGRFYNGDFIGFGHAGVWWSSTHALSMSMSYDDGGVISGSGGHEAFGFSARCLRN